MKATWLVFLSIYLLTLVPAGFMWLAAFAQRNIDLSGDAWSVSIALGIYLVGVPLGLLLTRPRRALADTEAAE